MDKDTDLFQTFYDDDDDDNFDDYVEIADDDDDIDCGYTCSNSTICIAIIDVQTQETHLMMMPSLHVCMSLHQTTTHLF